ncbi:transposase [Thiolapillus sp.]|uniref:transposase n=1 Tax=Thiolapillus sp. TaxID=2017437 RepID=UPI0027E5ABCC|nr:transposase [Thiolapillus sp.]
MTRTAGAPIGCQRPSRFWGLGCPKIYHEAEDTLEYKAIARSGVFEEVNEAYSTQVCSCCGAKPDSSPKGRTDLGIRHWICSECGAEHDRDINAAKNILAAGGHPRLDGGILVLQGE